MASRAVYWLTTVNRLLRPDDLRTMVAAVVGLEHGDPLVGPQPRRRVVVLGRDLAAQRDRKPQRRPAPAGIVTPSGPAP